MDFLGTVSIGTAPTIYYDGWWTAQRIDNTTMRYIVEFNARFHNDNSGGFLGYGYELLARVLIQAGSNSKYSDWVRIKNQDYDTWGPNEAGGQTLSNFKFTVDFPSSQAGENASVTLIIDEGESRANDNTSVGSRTVGTVTSSALLYTAVQNPTSISVTGLKNGIAAPGQELTFQWSGAQAGVNNEIVGYSFGYKTTAEPPSNKNDDIITELDRMSTSITWVIPDTRETTYYFFIKTRGAVTGYNAEWQQLSETCLVNSLPSAPLSTVSTLKVANAGGQIAFNLTAGEDANSNQNLSLYYTIDDDIEKIPTAPNFSYELKKVIPEAGAEEKKSTTFKFFTFDGLEYSENFTPVVVSFNSIPTITEIVDNSEKSYARTVTVNTSDEDDANLSYTYELWRGNSKLYTYTSNEPQYSIGDIRDFIDSKWTDTTEFKWRVTVFDGFDYSEAQDSASFKIIGCPTVKQIYNNLAFANVENSNDEHFSNNVRIELNIPQGVTMEENPQYTGLRLKVNGINYPSTSTMNTIEIDGVHYYTNFSGLKANTQPGTAYTFEVYLIGSNNKSWLISNNITLTRAPLFNLSGLVTNALYPFQLDAETTISMAAFANNGVVDENRLQTDYSLLDSGFRYYLTLNGQRGTISNAEIEFSGMDTILLQQSGQELFNSIPENSNITPWTQNYIGNQSQITIEAVNVFGDVVSVSVNYPIYFVQAATVVPDGKSEPALYIGNQDVNVYFDPTKHFLQENVYLYGDAEFEIQDYFECQSAQLEINRGGQGWQYLNTITPAATGDPYTLNNPIKYSFNAALYTVKSITSSESYDCKLRIAFTNTAGQTSYFNFVNDIPDTDNSSYDYLVLPHKPATVNIDSATYADEVVKFSAAINYGFDAESDAESPTNLIRDLSYSADFGDETQAWSDSSLPALLVNQFKPIENDWSWQNLTLTVTTTQTLKLNAAGDTVVSEATATSNTVVVYNILPTVAYRLNHLGINTKDFGTHDVLVVAAASNRDIVKFTSSAGNITLNLSTGLLEGISIDFGVWN